jgi:hypothetical protein
MAKNKDVYPASLDIDYPKQLDRVSSFFRLIWSIPILVIVGLLTSSGAYTYTNEAGKMVSENGGGIAGALFAATALMILFRQRYPKWWFNFNLELNRFTTRVGAYLFLLTDKYPSTEDEQSVHLNLEYPDVKQDLDRWLPLFKWFLAIPHYIVLSVLVIGAIFATIIAWFSILFTGTYPKGLFDYVVGVGRWGLRVSAYSYLLTTDKYPPFSLK